MKELFGQFLVRKGVVKQSDIEEALILQDMLQDSLGAVALANDLISFSDVEKILAYLDDNETSFALAAIELNILTEEQVRKIHKKYPEKRILIGQLLCAIGRLSNNDLNEHLPYFHGERELLPSRNITKKAISDQVAQNCGLEKNHAAALVDSVLDIALTGLTNGNELELRGFGSFKIVEKKPRNGVHPSTGDKINIPGRKSVKLIFSESVKKSVEGDV